MKIAISTLSDISMNDGTSVRAKRVFEQLQKEGYDCTLIIRGRGQREANNVEVIKPSQLWNFQLIPIVLKNRFNLVYCSADLWGFFTYFALAKLYNFKVVFEAHGILSLEREQKLPNPSPIDKVGIKMLKWREKFAAKHADCIIALCSDIYKHYATFNKSIFLIPVFVDETTFKRRVTKAQCSEDYEGKTVGLIGPFAKDWRTNTDTLDFVYRNVDTFDERIKFTVIGACDYKRIRSERIQYVGYLKRFQDYVDQLTRLDAVLVASTFPTSGPLNKILEPMACSVPVFTTPVGAIGLDHITPGQDIFIYNTSEMVMKINESLFDAELMERVGGNARRTIEIYYSAAVNEKRLVKVIERMGSSTKHSP
jgi:glycosyltransferase involved in cell wall biosynthesis